MSSHNLVRYTTPPQKGCCSKGGDKPSWQQGSWGGEDSNKMKGRNKEIYSFFSLEAKDLQLEAEDSLLEVEEI